MPPAPPEAEAARPILLGFSGGGDSTALLLHLRQKACAVHAVVVDHGLRPQSAAEAQVAAARARALGASTEIIRLHLAPNGGHAAWRR
ncbi:MAG: 7-cyano-7-deazaguanine synthase, partial [Hyphomonadaceae bacterium]|nr:7-cyano-7-deazaguanine synthase [Hyphomonadaceae bacterium]